MCFSLQQWLRITSYCYATIAYLQLSWRSQRPNTHNNRMPNKHIIKQRVAGFLLSTSSFRKEIFHNFHQ
ncbi:hypothetical protein VCHA50P417_140002 [Vibrio chagasii]|nr:hypothetical protein VCHA35O142_120109 [Vibrio chagasii]CAH6950529.1 hypothetical protein VCHA50P417_140002 [Vibrio chagasii]CAH6993776.1 hypothetical protein VCHA48P442_140002 [Vibrio chagasii]